MQADAFRGHGLSLFDEQKFSAPAVTRRKQVVQFSLHNLLPAGSSAHAPAISAGVAAFHFNPYLPHPTFRKDNFYVQARDYESKGCVIMSLDHNLLKVEGISD